MAFRRDPQAAVLYMAVRLMPDTVEADRKRRFCREAVGEDHGCENSAVKIDKYTNIKAGQACASQSEGAWRI
jgi:hypothetical protein